MEFNTTKQNKYKLMAVSCTKRNLKNTEKREVTEDPKVRLLTLKIMFLKICQSIGYGDNIF